MKSGRDNLALAKHVRGVVWNVTVQDVHQGLSKQLMEEACLYGQRYNPGDPPSYQYHARQHHVYPSNGYSDAYYGYEDPPPPYPPSQTDIEETFQLLCQKRKELHENQRRVNTQLTTLTLSVIHLVTQFTNEVHECLGDVEVENGEQEVEGVDQEVEDEDKEPNGMEIVHSISYGTNHDSTPRENDLSLILGILIWLQALEPRTKLVCDVGAAFHQMASLPGS
ncbi:hypothetical protein PIB30_052281 [Stylosanthes scabra]|uniref:Uncharacterized protein n=1 Tax=Stylosanthes scabra TaxID=79078 RepID=A0ABU6YGY6_9FABA|nr:hypothetical protein [Stylosanthes scabra]